MVRQAPLHKAHLHVSFYGKLACIGPGNTKGGMKYHCTVGLLFDWFGIICMTTDNCCFYLQNRLIQTTQTGGQWYSDTSPLVFPDWSLKNASGSGAFQGSRQVNGLRKRSLK
jgi:hypothetical protein